MVKRGTTCHDIPILGLSRATKTASKVLNKHRGSVCASHPTALGLILGIPFKSRLSGFEERGQRFDKVNFTLQVLLTTFDQNCNSWARLVVFFCNRKRIFATFEHFRLDLP